MSTGSWPTLIDVASRTSPDGKLRPIAELLSQCNEINDDIPWMEANEMGGHEFVFRTSIPAGSWRQYNMGISYSKSTTAKSRVGLAMLEDYSQVDRALAEDSGDPTKFRESEDIAFLEGMGQTITQTFWYGNTAANPAQFMGFSTFYNAIAGAANGANVLSGGGTGTNNASIWLIGWGEGAVYGLFPRGSSAGLMHEDKGDVRAAYDALGNPFEAYTSWFRQKAGLCPQDWRQVVRLANIDVTNAGLAGPNAFDIFAQGMAKMMLLPPKMTGTTSGITKTDATMEPTTRFVFYCNRTIRYWMDVQMLRNRNVLLQIDDYAGKPCMGFRGIPVKLSDQLLNTESTVS